MPKKKETTKKEETKEVEEKLDLTKLKKELFAYINTAIDDTYLRRIDNANKLLIKEKNKKILGKNIWINILLLIIVFLLYLLNAEGFFMRFVDPIHYEENTPVKETVNPKDDKDNKEVEKGPTLEELIKEHGYLLEKVNISYDSPYLEDYYDGNLTSELKHYLALNNLSTDKVSDEDDYSIIKETDLAKSYEAIFDDEFTNVSFKYGDNSLRYYKVLSSYITASISKKEPSNLKREIINVKVDGDKVLITTIEAATIDDKIYNIISKEEVADDNVSLKEIDDRITKRTYTFKDEKLVSIK